jgi:hypothetical protein
LSFAQGVHGGLAPNPAHEAARLFELASKENCSNISDFFSGWQDPPSEEILTLVTKYKDFYESYARDISISGDFKPKCHPWLPGCYPAVDIIGLKGGYIQEGVKYSLPTAVLLKILIRTAYDQKTAEVLALLKQFFQVHLQQGYQISFPSEGASSDPILIDYKNSFVQHAAQIIAQVTRNEVAYFWSGGSLPLAKVFEEFKIVPLIIGFDLQEDNIHAASESIKLSQILKGFPTVKRLIMEL